MKNAFLVFVLLFAFQFSGAQNSWEPSVGLNVSTLSWKKGFGYYAHGNPNSQYDIGWNAGYYFHFKLDELSAVKLGCFYNQLATQQSYVTHNREIIEKEIRLGYFKIPFQYEASFSLSDNVEILLTLGHYTQIGVGGNTKITYRDHTVDIPARFAAIEYYLNPDQRHFYYNPIDMGFTIGTGFQVKRFIFSVEYNYGLFNTLPRQAFSFTKDPDTPELSRIELEKKKWRYFTFNLSYRLPFAKD